MPWTGIRPAMDLAIPNDHETATASQRSVLV